MIHSLKTLPTYFNRVWEFEKEFEIRKNDRSFQTGDKLELDEWSEKEMYTGRRIECTVKYVLHGFEGLADGYVALGIEINRCIC
jgi:hypothetical protein